jgi:hypothetical protein
MSHHPGKIKNPPKWQMSYDAFAILNVVELNRKGPALHAGPFVVKESAADKVAILLVS